jgi:organic hydroperoxide reductase OsmC/OhrA
MKSDRTGNDGDGTKTYKGYRRDHTIVSEGKRQIQGSVILSWRSISHNPEELLVASLSSCQMLWYLHLFSLNHVAVLDYREAASGVAREFTYCGSTSHKLLRPSPTDEGKRLRKMSSFAAN